MPDRCRRERARGERRGSDDTAPPSTAERPRAGKLLAMRTLRHLTVPLLLTTVVLAGCAERGDGEPASGTSALPESSTAAPTSAPAPGTGAAESSDEGGTDAPPFPADPEPDTADASADALVTVRDVRLGRQEGFDRVVFEVDGTGTPGWDVRYVDAPASEGTGAPVEVAGDAVLQVSVTGTGYPFDTGVEEYSGPDPLSGGGTQVVTEVHFDGTYEGTTVAFVGTATEAPFRVYLLQNPTRVVLEVVDVG